MNCLSLPFTFASSAVAPLFSVPPFPVLSTSNSLKRGSISPSENRSDHLATRESAYVFLFSAKNSNIPTKHTQSRTENALFQFCLTITEPFFSYLSGGNERLLKSQRFTHRSQLTYGSLQTYRCIQISSVQEKPQERTLTYWYKSNLK